MDRPALKPRSGDSRQSAIAAAESGTEVLVVSDAALSVDRPPVPSILAAGAVHTALTEAGLRGRTDIVVDAADILAVHSLAMVLAVGATAAHPRLAIEMAVELAGTRGAEEISPAAAVANLVAAFEAGLRKTLARMGISAVSSYVGGALVDTVDLAPAVVARCFPTAAAWPGRTSFADLGARVLRRRAAALALPPVPAGREPRLPDPGFARFRADGEAHLFSPAIAREMQVLSGSIAGGDGGAGRTRPGQDGPGRAPSTRPSPGTVQPWPAMPGLRSFHATTSASSLRRFRSDWSMWRTRARSRAASSCRR